MEKENIFIGELGEVINLYVLKVKPEGEEAHFSVGLELDGFTFGDDGSLTLIFSPSEAKRLAEKLLDLASEATSKNTTT